MKNIDILFHGPLLVSISGVVKSVEWLFSQSPIRVINITRKEESIVLMDYHIHSTYSSDGRMTMEEVCLGAIELGISEIAFTDHIDLDWPDPNITFNIENLQRYMADIREMSKRFAGKLEIRAGIEVGLQHHMLKQTSEIIHSYPFDFVIGSVHLIGRMDPYLAPYYEGKTKEESYRCYYQEILELISVYDDFDVLGHLDYIRRYSPYPYDAQDHKLGFDIVEKILEVLIKKGKGIEVNTSGYRHISHLPLPDFSVIKRYHELGGKIITTGSDGHEAKWLGYELKAAVSGIKVCGFCYLTSFEQRKPNQVRI